MAAFNLLAAASVTSLISSLATASRGRWDGAFQHRVGKQTPVESITADSGHCNSPAQSDAFQLDLQRGQMDPSLTRIALECSL